GRGGAPGSANCPRGCARRSACNRVSRSRARLVLDIACRRARIRTGAAAYNHRQGRPGKILLERVAADQAVLVSTGANDWMESSGAAERADGGFRISARKTFASGSPKGDVLVTSAPFDAPKEGPQVVHFAVPFAAPGVSLADDWQTLGMRATGSRRSSST